MFVYSNTVNLYALVVGGHFGQLERGPAFSRGQNLKFVIFANRKLGHLHYLHFRWKFMKASMEASIVSMEASTASTEAFIASMEAFTEAVEASMEAMEASMEAWKLPWK